MVYEENVCAVLCVDAYTCALKGEAVEKGNDHSDFAILLVNLLY